MPSPYRDGSGYARKVATELQQSCEEDRAFRRRLRSPRTLAFVLGGSLFCFAVGPFLQSRAPEGAPQSAPAVTRIAVGSTPPPATVDPFRDLPPLDADLEGRVFGYDDRDESIGYELAHDFTVDAPGCAPTFHFVAFNTDYRITCGTSTNDQGAFWKIRRGFSHGTASHALRGPFPYPDLTFTFDTTDHEGSLVARVGARLRSVNDAAPVHPVEIELGRIASHVRLAYLNVTKKGDELGVVVLWNEGRKELATVRTVPVCTFVAASGVQCAAQMR